MTPGFRRSIDMAHLAFTVAGGDTVVRKQIHQAINGILSVKDFIAAAASSELGLAWAGVLVLLR